MIHHATSRGNHWGVSCSTATHQVLVQVQEEGNQSRIPLTPEQAESMASELCRFAQKMRAEAGEPLQDGRLGDDNARAILKKHAAAWGDKRYEPARWVVDALEDAYLVGRCMPKELRDREVQRVLFESHVQPMGFDLTRRQCAAVEPWSEYASEATGYYWAGWLAKAGIE